MAQANTEEVKVETITKELKLDIKVEKIEAEKAEVARLYLHKNSRIKKALNFKTKSNKAKMA